ncbi:MAG: thioredoxin family protein [candidate division Zixibacteria bacterium]|nr:thioredoxin family protein [candidate division Zixibacteria bacterium]
MKIEILGPGCMKCEKLYEIVERTLKELGKEAEISKVKDIKSIMQYGVLMTPALVINGKVLCSGRVPGLTEVKGWLSKV